MLKIGPVIINRIIEHSKKAYPREACGIIAGSNGKASKIYEMINTSETPELCYFMEPEEQLKVFKEIRGLGLELSGIYHSHPKSAAYPSKRDCELAFYPDAVYAIVSLEDFKNPILRFFKIIEDKIKELK